MIVIWSVDEKGNFIDVIGLCQNEEDFKAWAVDLSSKGKLFKAGDVVPFDISYSPPAVAIKRAI